MKLLLALWLVLLPSIAVAQTYTVTFTAGAPATSHQVCVDAACAAATAPTASIGPLANGTYSITVKTFNGAAVTTSTAWPLTVGGAAPPLATDTFTGTTGTLLSAHTAADGTAWTKHPTSLANASITSNKLAGAVGSSALYFASTVPPTANYSVQADVTFVNATGGAGPVGRLNATANTCYFLRVYGSANRLELYKGVAGVFTLIGTWPVTYVPSTTATLKLTMLGSLITGSYNGVVRISVTDTAVTAAGRAGVRLYTSVASELMDNFSVSVP